MHRSLLLAVVLLSLPHPALAQEEPRVRPTVYFGFSFALVGLDTYGIAANVRAGVDLVFDPSHELTVTAGWTPYAMTGARLDLFAVEAGWRWRPAPEVGFYTLITVGAALGREALDVTLGQRRFEDVLVLPGAIGSIAVGWTLFDYVDFELSYRHALLAGEDLTSLGSFTASIGGRL